MCVRVLHCRFISLLVVSLMKAPLISQRAVRPPAPLCSCHCTPPPPHTLFSEDKLPNTHRKYPHTNLCTQAVLDSHSLTHTHTLICSFAGHMTWQPTRRRNIHSPYHPKPPNALYPTLIPPPKSALAPTLSQEQRESNTGWRQAHVAVPLPGAAH